MTETKSQNEKLDDIAEGLKVETQLRVKTISGLVFDLGVETAVKMIEQVKPQAEKRIKSRLVLEAVVKAENIAASDEDYEEELKTMAEAYQMEVDKVKELLPEKSVAQIKEDIAVRKAAEFVVENAKEK